MFLDSPLQGTGPVHRVITLTGQERLRCIRKVQGNMFVLKSLLHPFELNIHDGIELLGCKIVEDDDVVDSIQKLRLETGP